MISLASNLTEYNKETNRIQKNRILLVNVKENLSQLVGRRIKELGITKSELARRTGLSRAYIGNIVNQSAPTQSGQYDPSPEVIAKFVIHLQVSEDEMLTALGYKTSTALPPEQAQVIEVLTHSNLTDADYEKIRDFIRIT